MPVTDSQVATVRAFLAGDFERHRELREQLARDGARAGYLALIQAGCFEAIDRRFACTGNPPDVIDYVADVRARSEEIGERLDPRAAERLIRAVLGDGSIDDFDAQTRFSTETLLLGALIMDEKLDGPGLDQFLAEARRIADRWI